MPARYIDLHVLQQVPASVLNRGEYDEPKTMKMGNAMRAVVSSQCWKRHIRLDLEDQLDEHAVRTRNVPLRVADALRAADWPADLAAFAGAQVARSATPDGLDTDPAQGGLTRAMLWVHRGAVDDIVAVCQSHRPALEEAHARPATPPAGKTKGRGKKDTDGETGGVLPTRDIVAQLTRRTASISLFGRMLAEIPAAQVDGAVQIAPAFTVHASDRQPDFFTTTEDWPTSGQAGSAHLQTAFFTTGVLYRYATVNLTELSRNLGGDHDQAQRLLNLFIESFIMTIPQAKKTSTAPHTLPSLAHYVVRDRRPVSYAAAFEQPVTARPGGGYLKPATDTFAGHAAALTRLIGTRHRIAHGHTTTQDKPVDHLGTHHPSFEELADACTTAAGTHSTTREAGAA